MTPVEEAVADLWATGVSPDGHPTIFVRDELTQARGADVVAAVGSASRGRWCGWPGWSRTVNGR